EGIACDTLDAGRGLVIPIAGIAITNEAKPLSPVLIASMLSALKIGELADTPATGTSRLACAAQIGAASQTTAASTWFSEEIMVACDCDREDIAGLQNGTS